MIATALRYWSHYFGFGLALAFGCAAAAPSSAIANDVLTDSLGDPLPPGAIARLGALRFRHDGLTLSLTFTPDGKYVVGSGFSGVIVWEAASGRERLRIADGIAVKLAISPDGQTLAIYGRQLASAVPTIKFWDLRTGKHLPACALPKDFEKKLNIGQLGFSPDGKHLVFNTVDDGKVRVFDLASGQVRSFGGERASCYSLAVSPASNSVAVAARLFDPATPNAGYGVEIWDLATGQLIRAIHRVPPDKGEAYAKALAFSRDGKLLAFGAGEHVLLFNAVSGQQVGQIDINPGQDYQLALTPDGKRLVACDVRDWKVHVLDVATGKLLHTLEPHKTNYRFPFSMALSPDGATIALGTVWNALQFWDLASGKELFTEHQGHFSQINGVAFSPDGNTLASCGGNGPVLLWDTPTWRRTATLPGESFTVAFSPNGLHLASASAGAGVRKDTTLRIWDVSAKRYAVVRKVPDVSNIIALAYSLDGRQLLSLNGHEQNQNNLSVRRWDTARGKYETLWATSTAAALFHFAPDGKNVFQSNYGNEIGIINIASRRERHLRAPEGDQSCCLACSPDTRLLASATLSPLGHVRLFEIATGKEAFLLKGHNGFVAAIAWSRDGRLVACGDQRANQFQSTPMQTTVWDTYTGQQLAAFGGFKSRVRSLAFSPDERFLAAGLQDSTILVWDVGQLRKPQPAQLTKEELEQKWADLGGDDAGQAQRAIGTLILAPKQIVPFLNGRVKPIAAFDQAKIRQWIAELDSEKFALRQAAAKDLEKIGAQVQVPVRNALQGRITLETRRRLEQVLSAVQDVPGRETVRVLRAIMVLERIASPEARNQLDRLAHGAPGARETEDAQASLERLKLRDGRF